MSTVNNSTPYDPTQDPRYAAFSTSYDAQTNQDAQAVTNAQNEINKFVAYYGIPSNIDPTSQAAQSFLQARWPEHSPGAGNQLQGLIQTLQTAQGTVASDQSDKANALSDYASKLSAQHDGEEILQAAQQAGQAMAVDFSGMSLGDMITSIMGATNKATDSIATAIANDLQAQNNQIGQLNSLLKSLNAQLPPGTDDPDVKIDPSVLQQVADLGANLPTGTSTDSKTGNTVMKKDQLQVLLENIKTQTETLSNNQTDQLQKLTKANNNHNERSDMISHVIDTTHETDANALR